MRLKPLIYMVIAAVGAYVGYWFYLAHSAGQRVDDLIADLARSGFGFEYEALDVSGFPYRLVLDFKGAEMEYRDGPLRLSSSGPSLQAIIQPWQPDHALLFAGGSLISVSYRTGTTAAYTIEPELLRASLQVSRERGARHSLVLENSRIQSLTGSLGESTIGKIEIHFRSRPLTAAGASASGLVEPVLADISVILEAPEIDHASAEAADRVALDLQLRGRFLPRLTRYSLAAWRDAGSTLDIDRIDAQWGGTRIAGDGSLTLDNDLRPLGAISLRTDAPEQLLERMLEAGWVTRAERADAESAIGLFRSLAPQGAPVTLPLSLQGGGLNMGPVRLTELGPLVPR